MEPLFTNKSTYTKNALRESLLNYQKRQRTIIVILICAVAFISLLQLLLSGEVPTITLLLFLILMYLFAFVFVPIYSANLSYERNFEVFHEEVANTFTFFDDHFVSLTTPSNATIDIHYNQLQRIVETKQYFLLVVSQNLFYIIDKSGFDRVNTLEFIKVLREKAPKAKFQL